MPTLPDSLPSTDKTLCFFFKPMYLKHVSKCLPKVDVQLNFDFVNLFLHHLHWFFFIPPTSTSSKWFHTINVFLLGFLLYVFFRASVSLGSSLVAVSLTAQWLLQVFNSSTMTNFKRIIILIWIKKLKSSLQKLEPIEEYENEDSL